MSRAESVFALLTSQRCRACKSHSLTGQNAASATASGLACMDRHTFAMSPDKSFTVAQPVNSLGRLSQTAPEPKKGSIQFPASAPSRDQMSSAALDFPPKYGNGTFTRSPYTSTALPPSSTRLSASFHLQNTARQRKGPVP